MKHVDLDALRANFAAVSATLRSAPARRGQSRCLRPWRCTVRRRTGPGRGWLAVSVWPSAGLGDPANDSGHVQPKPRLRLDPASAHSSLLLLRAGRRPEPGRPGRRGPGCRDTESGGTARRIGFALRTDFHAAIADGSNACRLPGLQVTGLFQHFAVADETSPTPLPTRRRVPFVPRTYQALSCWV